MRTATINTILHFLQFFVFVRTLQIHDETINAVQQFPISLPNPIQYPKEGGAPFVPADDANPCLLYVESLSVVVFNMEKKWSAWADIGTTGKERKDGDTEQDQGTWKSAKYGGKIQCPSLKSGPNEQSFGKEFTVALDVTVDGEGANGYQRGSRKEKQNIFFTVNQVKLDLIFNYTRANYWELVNAVANSILIKGVKEVQNLDVNNNWKLVSGRSSSGKKEWFLTDIKPPSWNINGFKDYSFACDRTSSIVWADTNNNEFAVGVTLNNIQLQPFNATYSKEGIRQAKFGWKVNDCAPLFSIGTWMGLIVALLLISVLSFGFLMLNSVQTMDRFDDPKQKQLVINAKE